MDEEPHRRLLDLLAGWADFRGEAPHGKGYRMVVEVDAIGDLYQAAGQLEPGTPEQVREFIDSRVVPFLLGGPSAPKLHP